MSQPPANPAPLADLLVLASAPGVSLAQMRDKGVLETEWALPKALLKSPHGPSRILLLTWGGPADEPLAAELGPRVGLVRVERGSTPAELAEVGARVAAAAGDAARVLVKTSQMEAGDLARAVAQSLRQRGVTTGLVARGGYLWSQFLSWEQGPASPAAVAAGQVEQRLCADADMVVGTTKEMIDDLAWRYNVGEERQAIVPHYVLSDESPLDSTRAVGVILFIGRLVPQKRVDRLIDAVAQLREDLRRKATLSIIGQGPLEHQLRSQAAAAGVRAVFEPELPHDQLVERMRRCAVYAQTSAFEGHPKTVIEAMNVGTPVVVADSPGVRGIVRHAVTGLCVHPDPESIRLALEGVLDDPDWGEVLGSAGAAHCRGAYALPRIIDQELAMLRRAMDNAVRRAAAPRPAAAA